MFDRDLISFSNRVHDDIDDRIAAGNVEGGPYSENAFTGIVMDYLSEAGMVDEPCICHFEGTWGRGSGKVIVSGYAIPEDEARLDIFATIFCGNREPQTVSKEDVAKTAGRAAKFFEAACNGIHETLEPASTIAGLAARIKRCAETIERVRVFVLTDGIADAARVNATEIEGTPVTFEVYDLSRLFKGMHSGESREDISINFSDDFGGSIPCLKMPDSSPDYTAYLAIMPGDVLYRLYEEYGSRLLEKNVRSFLSARGKINRGIRDTIVSTPGNFLAFNNGIVITVDKIETERLQDNSLAIKSVTDLQIVNGGQTTASIHQARKLQKADLSAVQVPAKITVIKAEKLDEMVGKISRYANSQNTVQPADFSANDPFHVRIEELAGTIWCPGEETRWFYERARGSYQVALTREGNTPARAERFRKRTPPQQRFSKTDLAKYINAWDHKPHLVSYGAQKNFDYFMQGLRVGQFPDWTPDEAYYRRLIALAILWRAGHAVVRREKESGRIVSQPANVAAYLVAYLSWASGGNLNFALIWQNQKISPALIDLLCAWAHKIDVALQEGARGRMVSEWAKKEACWESVKSIPSEWPDLVPPEIGSVSGSEGSSTKGDPTNSEPMSPEDLRNIERCKCVDGPTWLSIHAWGKKSGHLQKWQIGISHTLAGYAASGWSRGPSVKQAKHGVAILDLAIKEGGKLAAAIRESSGASA